MNALERHFIATQTNPIQVLLMLHTTVDNACQSQYGYEEYNKGMEDGHRTFAVQCDRAWFRC